jgi:hypothetical protein
MWKVLIGRSLSQASSNCVKSCQKNKAKRAGHMTQVAPEFKSQYFSLLQIKNNIKQEESLKSNGAAT